MNFAISEGYSSFPRTRESKAATPTGFGLIGSTLKSSCADLIRASTSLFRALEGVAAHGTRPWAEGPRVKPGQDEIFGSIFRYAAARSSPDSFAFLVRHER